MKKFLLTSACTLVLSLLGAFGSNQNSLNLEKIFQTDSDTTKVEENVTNIDTQSSLPSDNQSTVAETAAVDDVKLANEVTPQVANNEETTNISAEANLYEAANETAVSPSEETSVNTDTNTAAVKDNTTTNAVTNTEVKAAPVPVKNTTSTNKVETNATTNTKSNNVQTYVYKNVDLSQCDSTNEVVAELQKNGYTYITKNNIQNIQSLEDILSVIEGNKPTNNTTPTTAPTTSQPVPTTKPTTTKPTPTTQPAPTTKPSNSTNGISNYASEVLRLVNMERQKAGLSALTTNSTLTSAANKRAQETVQSFSHTRPNGTQFSTALKEYGVPYRAAGENIAYGQRTPQEVVTGWMNSPGHRANILNSNFNKIGIGVYQSNGTIYWSQLFTD